MGNINDSVKNNNTSKTVQRHPGQQTSDNKPRILQDHPLQETSNNTPRTAQNQSRQQTCETLPSSTVPSVTHKLCALCGQKIDTHSYFDHVSNCTGQKPLSSLVDSYSSKQNPNFDRNNDTRTTHRQLQTEIDSTNENADYSRSRASTSYLKVKLFDFHFSLRYLLYNYRKLLLEIYRVFLVVRQSMNQTLRNTYNQAAQKKSRRTNLPFIDQTNIAVPTTTELHINHQELWYLLRK